MQPVSPLDVREVSSSRPQWNDEILRRFRTSNRYLVGVSGGRDSVALLHWLLSKGYRELVVVHLDHGLRGRSSTADARFVEQLAKKKGLRFVSGKADVRQLAKMTKSSVETAARAARFEFFAQAARRSRSRTIFLGHHADDLVETFLINLFRGSGNLGRAIRPIAVRSLGKSKLTIVRPLLHVWRREIDDYVAREGLKFREDASNASLQPTRNRMRHKIVPAIENELGRGIRKTVWRAAVIASEEDAFLDSLVPEVARASQQLKLDSFGQQPIALQRRMIRAWLQAQHVSDISFDLVESVRGLLDLNVGPAKTNLPGDRHARRRAGELFIE